MDPLRELEIELQGNDVKNRISKFQKLWRSKRVFTNTQGSWKLSSSYITTKIASFKIDIDIDIADNPKGFSEIKVYKTATLKPTARWTPSNGWIGDLGSINKVVAKIGQSTVAFTKNTLDILGSGNHEPALLACVKSGWIPKSVLKEHPVYKNVNGVFYANKTIDIEYAKSEFRKLPASMLGEISTMGVDLKVGLPALVLKLKKPKWTYQFFKNGTVLFSGLKNPDQKDEPRKLFKEFFTEYDLDPMFVFNLGARSLITKPKTGNNKKAKLANRYPLAGTWNSLRIPPHGFYIRPGTNGKPRLYMWRKMEKEPQTGELLNRGALNLSGVVPKVIKAFKNANRPIPQTTLNAFASAGFPIEIKNKKSVTGLADRRAPSWNSTKPGFYVRPGPGKQPYWFKIPTGIASGRKTVISTYANAGRNIPMAVRNIFKIPANVKTNVVKLSENNEAAPIGKQHAITMGLNGILRINNRQATRLTKKELVAIARNMNISQINAKMNPSRIIDFITQKAGLVGTRANKNYHVQVGNSKFKLLMNFRVERTVDGKRTTRKWATMAANERQAIANALVPANVKAEFNAIKSKNNKFGILYSYAQPPKAKTPSPQRSASSANSSTPNLGNNFVRNLEYRSRIENSMGRNYFKNENVAAVLSRINALPSGSRGKPLKANINKTIKTYVKETLISRRKNIIRKNYETKVNAPNWVPVNRRTAYKAALVNLATTPNAKGKYPSQKNVKEGMRAWMNAHLPKVGRAAYEKENMLTGEIIKVPAWNPPKNPKINVPKRLSPPKK
jgi:hypothetical protein